MQDGAVPPLESRKVELPSLLIRADVSNVNEQDRSVELVFSTGAPVERYDWRREERYIETLSLDPVHIRMGRLQRGVSVLDSHNGYALRSVIGRTTPNTATLKKAEGRVRARFSKRDDVTPLWRDILDGIVQDASIGYRVYRYEEIPAKGSGLPTRNAIDWEPFEVSMVSVPADAGAGIRGDKNESLNACEIVLSTRMDHMDMNLPKVGDRVKVIVPPHEEGQTEGVVRQVIDGALGIEFDGMPGMVHHWYVPSEVMVTEAAAMPTEEGRKQDAMAPGEPIVPKEKTVIEQRSDTIVEKVPADVPVKPPAPTEQERATIAERTRTQGIITACRAAMLPSSYSDKLIADGVSLLDARGQVLDELQRRGGDDRVPDPRPPGDGVIEVGDSALVHQRAGIEAALLHRIAPQHFKLEDVGRRYMGTSLMDFADIYLRAAGLDTRGIHKMERAGMALQKRGGMHSTSDFPSLLADVTAKTLRAAYEAAPQTFLPISQQKNLTDFKPSKQLQLGEAPALLIVGEGGEFQHGTIGEGKEQFQLATYGRIFAITRQALVNDDLNAFAEVPGGFGKAARNLESQLAWAQITTVPNLMGDGVTLFDAAAHFNYDSVGNAITIASLGEGRASMRAQKGLDGSTILNLFPRFLIVPAALETVAEQFVAALTPNQASQVNAFGPQGRTPLTVIVEPRLDAASESAWYLACDPAQAPVLYYGVLDGQTGPTVEQELGFEIDGLKIKCRHDVAFKAADFRAIYKNVGGVS